MRAGFRQATAGKSDTEWAGFSFVFKARQPAHGELCNGRRNAECGRKDEQAGM